MNKFYVTNIREHICRHLLKIRVTNTQKIEANERGVKKML